MLPANLRDKKNGDYVYPAYKWQDALGVWHEKALDECTRAELAEFSIKCFNALVYCEATSEKIVEQRNIAEKTNDKLMVENSVLVNRVRNLLASEERLRKSVGTYQWFTAIFLVSTIVLSLLIASLLVF